jgi:hypothetical protein
MEKAREGKSHTTVPLTPKLQNAIPLFLLIDKVSGFVLTPVQSS